MPTKAEQMLIAWAGARRCLPCGELGAYHRARTIRGSRGPRLALLRAVPYPHEFDPGERRRSARSRHPRRRIRAAAGR